jgi:hypothetical protein
MGIENCPVGPLFVTLHAGSFFFLSNNMTKAAFNKETLFTSKLDLNLRKKVVKCYIWSTAVYGAETWTLRKVDQKYLESFDMWCWRRMGKMSWTDRMKNEVLHRVKEEGNILHRINSGKANLLVTCCV